MKLIYIAAPYRAKTIIGQQHNIYEASLIAKYFWLQNFAVICPHLNTKNFDGLIPEEQFLFAGLEMIEKCSHIAFHPDWKSSPGCLEEHTFAKTKNLTIYYVDQKDLIKTLSPIWRKL